MGSAVDVMTPPNMVDEFPSILNASGLTYQITISDVEKFVRPFGIAGHVCNRVCGMQVDRDTRKIFEQNN